MAQQAKGLDSPCYSHRLPHLQRRLEGFPVNWRDLINAQTGAHKNQSGLEVTVVVEGHFHQAIFIDICTVTGNVNSHASCLVLIHQVLNTPCRRRRAKPLAGILAAYGGSVLHEAVY